MDREIVVGGSFMIFSSFLKNKLLTKNNNFYIIVMVFHHV